MSARRNTLVLAALVCATVIPAACGSDADTASSTPATTPATTPTEATTAATDAPMTSEPATTEPATTEPMTTEAAPSMGSIIDVATAAGNFTTLLAAVEAAGLTETLATSKLTVLAPTDEAFAKLGQPAIDAVLADPAALVALLQNHVLPQPQDAKTLSIFSSVVNLNGTSLAVVSDGTTVTIGGATVTAADVQADNGIIHVIDTVLVPAAG